MSLFGKKKEKKSYDLSSEESRKMMKETLEDRDFTPTKPMTAAEEKKYEELYAKEHEYDEDRDELSPHIIVEKEQVAAGAAVQMIGEAKRILEKPLTGKGKADYKDKARAGKLANEMRQINLIVPEKYKKEFDALMQRLQYFAMS